MKYWLVAFALSGCCIKCGDSDVHTDRQPSTDGGTELIAGPFSWKCAATIDGKPVTQGKPVAVKPGRHVVSCDAESLEVDVLVGTSVTVDYFGP